MMEELGEDGIGSCVDAIRQLKTTISDHNDQLPGIKREFQTLKGKNEKLNGLLASSNELSEKLFLKTGKLETFFFGSVLYDFGSYET